MYIEPNTTIQLFKNLQLDSDYNNTLWFANLSAQESFFSGLNSLQFSNQSYQRKDRGVIRLNAPISTVFDCNYMRFKNTSFENKWYYAFVTRVEYVNNNACNIYYSLDIIQSYFFDFELHSCLIERQHSTTDVAGDNLEIEALEIGDAIADGGYSTNSVIFTDISDYDAMVCKAKGNDQTAPSGIGILSGMVSGLQMWQFVCTTQGITAMLQKLEDLAEENQTDTIASISMIPSEYTNLGQTSDDEPVTKIKTVDKATTLDGYTPVNKKLLTYPYCYLNVYNDKNESIDLRYELFLGNNCYFTVYGVTSATPEIIVAPSYDSVANNLKYSLSIGDFPQIPYATNTYKAWLAMNYDQNRLSVDVANQAYAIQNASIAENLQYRNASAVIGGLGAIGGAALNPNPANIVAGAASVAQGVVDVAHNFAMADIAGKESELSLYKTTQGVTVAESVAKKLPNSPHIGSSSSTVAIGKKGVYFQPMTIRRQFAEKVDKYFTMFGYAMNRVAVPNIHTRSEFTYVKTSGCNVSGYIPQDDKEAINMIFNKGIRFWVNYSNFENYNVSNSII